MRLAFGFAGVPPQIFDGFRRGQSKLVERDDLVLTESFRGRDAGFYANPHANFFLNEFAKLLRDDNQNKLVDTGFAVAYVVTHPGAAEFSERLFPAVLTIPVQWQLTGYNRTTWGHSLAELNRRFRQAAILARQVIPTLRKELTEQDSRTPWLLPVKNFRSRVLVDRLRTMHEALANGAEADVVIRDLRSDFEHSHPPQRPGSSERRCFIDDAGIEFHPPGRARHAFARGVPGDHPPLCLVSGRRRLGAPYDRAFHYDCGKGDGVLRAVMSSCHSGPETRVGTPHINVAPNDFVRA
jgi:hypothetical protein